MNPPDETGGGGVGDGAGDVHAGAALGEDVGGAVYPRHRNYNGNTTWLSPSIGVFVPIFQRVLLFFSQILPPVYMSMPLFSKDYVD